MSKAVDKASINKYVIHEAKAHIEQDDIVVTYNIEETLAIEQQLTTQHGEHTVQIRHGKLTTKEELGNLTWRLD